eukprot:4637470-Prymnesium_polylepis.1
MSLPTGKSESTRSVECQSEPASMAGQKRTSDTTALSVASKHEEHSRRPPPQSESVLVRFKRRQVESSSTWSTCSPAASSGGRLRMSTKKPHAL